MKSKPRKTTVRGELRYYIETEDPLTGKRKRQFFDTLAKAQTAQNAVNQTPHPTRRIDPALDPNVTLAVFAAEYLWSQIATRAWVRPGTIASYREHLDLRISRRAIGTGPHDVLGRVRVRDLTKGHVLALVSGMRKDGFAPATTGVSYMLFRQLLDRAVGRGLLPQHPVDRDFDRTELRPLLKVRREDRAVKAFTGDEAAKFLTTAREHSLLFDLYFSGFASGLRSGELLGLQLDDDQVNAIRGQKVRQLRISRTLLRGSTTKPVIGPTKGDKIRHVDVSVRLGTLLDQIKAKRPALALRHGWGKPLPAWVFVTRTGNPISATTLADDFARVLDLAGLGDRGFTPHSMRHTFATLHILRGGNGNVAKWLQQQLGHSKIGVTLDTYADWFKLVDTAAADALSDTLLGNSTGNSG